VSAHFDRSRRARRTGLLLGGCAVLALLALVLPRASRPGGIELVRAQAPEIAALPALVLADAPADVEPPPELDARTPAAGAPVEERVSHGAARSAPALGGGRVLVRAVDAVTQESLDRLHVRALSGTRLADRDSGARRFALELALTPDAYALLVQVPGYEPAELAPIRVAAGAVVELPTVQMQPGSARILGTVGRTLQPSETLLVELEGKGRRPCAACAPRFDPARTDASSGHEALEPCPQCGFAPECSRLPVSRSGDFAFHALASGMYALRLDDGRGHDVGEQLPVALRESECARIEMDAPILRTLHVELVDTDGASLAGAWGANVRHRRALHDARDNAPEERPVARLDWRFELHLDEDDVRTGTFQTPTAAGTTSARPAPFGGRKLGSGAKRSVDDKPLRDGQTLRPEPDEPRFAASPIEARVDEEGLVVFEGVPSYEQKLLFLCGAFRATVDLGTSPEDLRATAYLEFVRAEDTAATTFRALDADRYR